MGPECERLAYREGEGANLGYVFADYFLGDNFSRISCGGL